MVYRNAGTPPNTLKLAKSLTSNFQINSVLGGGWNHSGQGNHNSESVERTRAKSSKPPGFWCHINPMSSV